MTANAFHSDALVGNTSALMRAIGGSEGTLEASVGKRVPLTMSLPYMKIHLPTEMRVTDNDVVSAELNPLTSTITPEMRVSPQLVGVPSAFDIAGPQRPDDLSWKWDVLAKVIGNRRSLTLQFPSAAKFDFKFENTAGDRVVVKGNTVTATVDVRDELGLTQAERTLFTASGALIGAVGTVLAYPFLKGQLEPKPAVPKPAVPQPAVPKPAPAAGLAGNGPKKKRKHRR